MRVIEFDKLDSTNLEARRICLLGGKMTEPFALVAAEQTAGMGRMGREWVSPRGGLWMSVAWPVKGKLEGNQALPLVVGLGVARAVEEICGLKCQMKWTNDVLIGGKKVAGILCQGEVEMGVVIIGMGVNVNFMAAELGEGLRQVPTSLREELGREVDLKVLRERVLKELEELLGMFEAGGLAGMMEEIQGRLAWRGERVRCVDMQGIVMAEGILEGLDAEGHVVIVSGGEKTSVASGELRQVR